MTDTTTDALVERLRDLLCKATPGPWQATYEEGTKLRDEHGDLIGWLSHTHLRGRRPSNEVNANAALIAELRNAAPALLDTIAALKAENERLKERLEINHAYQVVDGKMQRVEADMSDYDGIYCRDETIRLQKRELDAQAARIAALERSAAFHRDAADQQDIALAAKQERIVALEGARTTAIKMLEDDLPGLALQELLDAGGTNG